MEIVKQINEYQDGLFCLLDEFFHRVTGQSVSDFGPPEAFSANIKKNPEKLVRRIPDSFKWVDKTIRPYYARNGAAIYPLPKRLGGFKLVLGGSGRFGEAHLDSIQQTLLYADTILVPDPFSSWIETPREEERFPAVSLIKAAFLLLQLKPILDAKLPFPAIVVFPSWEKILEERDTQTRRKQLELFVDIFTFYVSSTIQSIDDVQKFVVDHPDTFLIQAEKQRLFVPPGSRIGASITEALTKYEDFVSTWRSPKFLKYFSKLTTAQKVLNGILERLAPQFHLLENAEELRANSLMCLEEHAHYYKLIARTNSERLVHLSLLDNKQGAIMDALGSKDLRWLSKVPMKALIELRLNNENALFRNRLGHVAERLHEADLNQIDNVVAEINQEIAEMIFHHKKEVKEIQRKYSRKHGKTAVLAWTALVCTLIPSLAPFLGLTAPLAIAAKYVADKGAEILDKKKASKSIFGVLARSKPEETK